MSINLFTLISTTLPTSLLLSISLPTICKWHLHPSVGSSALSVLRDINVCENIGSCLFMEQTISSNSSDIELFSWPVIVISYYLSIWLFFLVMQSMVNWDFLWYPIGHSALEIILYNISWYACIKSLGEINFNVWRPLRLKFIERLLLL